MNDPTAQAIFPGSGLARLRQILQLLADLRESANKLDSVESLRRILEQLATLAELVGIDPAWTARLRDIMRNQHNMELMLAVMRYVLQLIDHFGATAGAASLSGPVAGSTETEASLTAQEAVSVSPQALSDWLPLVLQIIGLLRTLRGMG